MDFSSFLGPLVQMGSNLSAPLKPYLDRGPNQVMSSVASSEANRQEELQREFAQSGIQWRVEDAKRAGIHPIYALGASGASYSPVSSYSSGSSDSPRSMGQDISRAVMAALAPDERRYRVLQLDHMELQNELLRSQIIGNFQAGFPSNPFVSEVPLEVVKPYPEAPYSDPGAISEVGYTRTSGGGLAVVPSKDAKERIEDQLVPEAMWAYRNMVLPLLKGLPTPPLNRYPLPKGYEWVWKPHLQEFRPEKVKRNRAFSDISDKYQKVRGSLPFFP